jgi:hypothetical protein
MDTDPANFVIDLKHANNELIFKKKFFRFLPYLGNIIFKNKKSKRSYKTVGSKIFCQVLLDRMIEGSGSMPLTNASGRPINM